MKFIKEKLSLLYPLFLLLFYFYIRPQFRPLAQYVSNSLASANSYYWTLFGLETIYAVFTGFLVYRFSKKSQFLWGKNSLQSLLEAIFAACLVYWLDYFISGFVQGRAAVLSLFPRRNQPDRGSHPSGRDGRYPACDRRADLSWGLGKCLF